MNYDGFKEKEKINLLNTKNILDTLVLLANSEELLKQMEKLNIIEALDKVYSKNLEDIEIQIQVLKNQIVSLNEPKTEDDNDDSKK